MGLNDDDISFDAYMDMWKAEDEDLLEGFGLFFTAVAAALEAAGMVIREYFGVPATREKLFGECFLDENFSLARAGAMLRRIMDAESLDGGKALTKEMSRLNEYRNRLAPNALTFSRSVFEDTWPAMRRRRTNRSGDEVTIGPGELREQVARILTLRDRPLELLPLLGSAKKV
jgi:hypothetical protein